MFKNINSHFLKITAVQFLLGPIAIFYMVFYDQYYWLWATFIFWFLGWVMGESVFYHRYFSHKAFETHPLLPKIFSIFALLIGFGSPITFRAIHVGLHHAFSDKEGDSHSPIHGFWHAWFLWNAKKIKIPLVISKTLLKDKFYVMLETYNIKIWYVSFLLLALIDWRLPLFTLGLSGFIAMQMVGIANCYSHKYGSVRFQTNDNSRNNWWLSWITWQGGSALQNNHHAYPSRYHDSWAWYEFDIGKYLIPLIATKINHK